MPSLVKKFAEAVRKAIKSTIKDWAVGYKRKASGDAKVNAGLFDNPLPHDLSEGAGVLFTEPKGPVWGPLYDQLVGGRIMMVTLLVFFMIYLFRQLAQIVDIDDKLDTNGSDLWMGMVLSLGWYWIAVGYLAFMQVVTLLIAPSQSKTRAFTTYNMIRDMVVGLDFLVLLFHLPLLAANLSLRLVVRALFVIQDGVIYILILIMPVLIAFQYSGLPVLSGLAKRVAAKFIALGTMPVAGMAFVHGYAVMMNCGEFGTGMGGTTVYSCRPEKMPWWIAWNLDGLFALVLSTVLMVGLIYMCWKIFTYSLPVATKMVERGAKLGTNISLGAAAAGAGYPATGVTTAVAGPKRGVQMHAIRNMRGGSGGGGGDSSGGVSLNRTQTASNTNDIFIGEGGYLRMENHVQPGAQSSGSSSGRSYPAEGDGPDSPVGQYTDIYVGEGAAIRTSTAPSSSSANGSGSSADGGSSSANGEGSSQTTASSGEGAARSSSRAAHDSSAPGGDNSADVETTHSSDGDGEVRKYDKLREHLREKHDPTYSDDNSGAPDSSAVGNDSSAGVETTPCLECDAEVRGNNLREHLRREHDPEYPDDYTEDPVNTGTSSGDSTSSGRSHPDGSSPPREEDPDIFGDQPDDPDDSDDLGIFGEGNTDNEPTTGDTTSSGRSHPGRTSPPPEEDPDIFGDQPDESADNDYEWMFDEDDIDNEPTTGDGSGTGHGDSGGGGGGE